MGTSHRRTPRPLAALAPDTGPFHGLVSSPDPARVEEYLLGGGHSFGVDRTRARRLLDEDPHLSHLVWVRRRWLLRATRYLAVHHAPRLMVDLSTGVPTLAPHEELAAGEELAALGTHVVYVNADPVTHGVARLTCESLWCEAVLSDPCMAPDAAWDAVMATRLPLAGRDEEPVAVLAAGLADHVDDMAELERVLARWRDLVPPGSHLAVAHRYTDAHRGRDAARELDTAVTGAGWAPVPAESLPGDVRRAVCDPSSHPTVGEVPVCLAVSPPAVEGGGQRAAVP